MRTFIILVVLSVLIGAGSARAEQFLQLPLPSTNFPITCRWTCSNADGSTYYHSATDYGRTGNDTEVRAAATGGVVKAHDGLSSGQMVGKFPYGNHVRIRHPNGYETRYAHLLPNTITVRVGDRVEAGQFLGKSDNTGKSTGPHLHFEVRDPQGKRVNPYGDPPDYENGCGTNALWTTCPPTSAPPPDADGDGFTAAQDDCDDTNRDIRPDATERCNGRDDDCDGTADDPWRSGLAQDIGNPCTVGIGACARTGEWVCTRNGRATACSADPGAPSTESCNGLDDDCDGKADEDWRTGLATDTGNPCTVQWGSGACSVVTSGTWTCTPDGLAVVCDASEPPTGVRYESEESCNARDDDCDGVSDNVAYNNVAYNEAHCGACNAAPCDSGEVCIQSTCHGCATGRSICREHCLANHCSWCSSGNCGSGYSACIDSCRVGDFIDLRYFDILCLYGCQGA